MVGRIAKLNNIAKKLQKAILYQGLVVKMGTSQFYSKDQKRLITIFILSTPTLQRNKNGEWRMKDYEILRTASNVDIVYCLADIYKAVRDWEN